ncbi:hypothetical protein AW14_06795 [Siansivirga zeaxanthinifaciens CC-SAMT-1]|uniref:Uncharacterized protein n=1 Tax=Siansivirga zeaxanthinifaciens CC-SAMT-1 TaxID=1454006 RepID=A0A0C5WCS2_9FLAO|nr:hypothetical protein AW14_06795 [Siansivirga zeaxanthinifaciens CC-SAMT-1]
MLKIRSVFFGFEGTIFLFFVLKSQKKIRKLNQAFFWWVCWIMKHNGLVYGKLRACVRGFSAGKSDASKQSN